MKPVQQLSGILPDAIPSEVLHSTTPILLKGLVNSWPMVESARVSDHTASSYIEGFYKSELITLYTAPAEAQGRIFYNEDFTGFNFQRSRARLNDVLAKLLANEPDNAKPTYYIGSTMVDHWLPGFRSENDISIGTDEKLVSIWIGNQSRIAAHYDFPDNIACVVAGKRRFTLFPPDQLSNLYVGPLDLTPSGQAISLVDTTNPDLERFPLYAKAQKAALVADMEPGDALFIPSMWWHHVESFADFNVLVNYWWRTTPAYLGAPANALLHALMTMRDLPAEQKQIWRSIFDHYVFDQNADSFEHIPEHALGVLAPLDAQKVQAIKAQLTKFLQ